MFIEDKIEFTQYLRPGGRKKIVYAPCTLEIKRKATELEAKGLKFECEILTTSDVSLTIVDNIGDVGIEISKNDKSIDQALERLVNRAYKSYINTERH
jgi:hypothetical protein